MAAIAAKRRVLEMPGEFGAARTRCQAAFMNLIPEMRPNNLPSSVSLVFSPSRALRVRQFFDRQLFPAECGKAQYRRRGPKYRFGLH